VLKSWIGVTVLERGRVDCVSVDLAELGPSKTTGDSRGEEDSLGRDG
jgi:hypothetical protein